MLDEKFRRKVGSLANADEGRLDDDARERIVRRVVQEVPRLALRTRRIRGATAVAAPLLAAAAVAALVVGQRAGKHGSPAANAVTASLACAQRSPRSVRPAFVRDEAGQKLDLGAVAFARASADADIRLVEASPCRTIVELSSGTVTVHAKDLGGGELAVRTHDGEVIVHGTLFAVTEAGDALSVEVVEGRVQVAHKSASVAVTAGERVLASQLGVARGALTHDRAHELRAAVLAPEVVGFDALQAVDTVKEARKPAALGGVPRSKGDVETVELPASPDLDLLAQAEMARRTRDYGRARELYRQAAQVGGATGEAAWVALARMELGLGRASAALDATRQRRDRFGQGTLGPEALWIDVRSYRLSGDQERARLLAQELVRTWPASPQARAAEQWLSGR